MANPEVKPQRPVRRSLGEGGSGGFYFGVPMFLSCLRTLGLYPPEMPAKLKYCVYVLLSQKDNKMYIGFSTDLRQRLTAHFNGHVDATVRRRPLELIFCEYHASKADALRREKYFKTTAGKKALKLMLRNALA